MMASYIFLVVCVVLCTVHSYSIRGTILHDNGAVSEVKVSNYINGNNWGNTQVLTLDRLVDAETLPTLTLVNFKFIRKLKLTNIALEHVPVFINTSCEFMTMAVNKIINVPTNAFSVLQPRLLYLRNNEIQNMADRSINTGANRVYLSCNKLNNFTQSWFADPGNIETLHLDSNRIEYIEDRAFNQMTKLSFLELSYNRITLIGSEAFSTGITHLGLQFNSIAELSLNMFAHRDEYMDDLYLHHNQLGFLSEALLLKLKPEHITLYGNPWQCKCLRDIGRWLHELELTINDDNARSGEPVCVVPLSFQHECTPTVDTELQQTYARGLSPMPECSGRRCNCNRTLDL